MAPGEGDDESRSTGRNFLYPFEFVIEDARTRYTIAWTEPHTYELVDVVRVD